MNIHILSHKKFGKVRVVVVNDEVYFLAKDAAEVLAYKDTSKAIRRHVQAKDKFTFTELQAQICPDVLTGHFAQRIPYNAFWLNESGLYALVIHSNLPLAKEFQNWLTSEVLPSIRKNGYYINSNVITPPPEGELSRREKIEILRECLNCTDCQTLRNNLIAEIAALVTGKNFFTA